MRLARLFGLLALLVVLGFPQSAKAQNIGAGVVCDTPDQVRSYVLAENAPAALAVLNAEGAQFCAAVNVSFYVGNLDGTIVTKDGVWKITHVLIVGIITHGNIQPIQPNRNGSLFRLRVKQPDRIARIFEAFTITIASVCRVWAGGGVSDARCPTRF
jgi:hypothetical protein